MQIILQNVYIFLKHQHHIDPGNHMEKRFVIPTIRKQNISIFHFTAKFLGKPILLLNPYKNKANLILLSYIDLLVVILHFLLNLC